MTRWRTLRLVVAVPLGVACATGVAHGQADQRALASRITGRDILARKEAVQSARRLGPANIGAELRGAMITALERETALNLQRWETASKGGKLEEMADPEFLLDISEAVVELRDPRAIKALGGALGTGGRVIRAMAAFGEAAAPTVLDVARTSHAPAENVEDALIALRMMFEHRAGQPLGTSTVAQMRQVAEQRLTCPQLVTLLWRAIDLAVVLGDPGLRKRVEGFASRPTEIAACGISDPRLVQQTQQRAADRLAGVLPLPR